MREPPKDTGYPDIPHLSSVLPGRGWEVTDRAQCPSQECKQGLLKWLYSSFLVGGCLAPVTTLCGICWLWGLKKTPRTPCEHCPTGMMASTPSPALLPPYADTRVTSYVPPKIRMLTSLPPVPQDVTTFGNRVFKEVMK